MRNNSLMITDIVITGVTKHWIAVSVMGVSLGFVDGSCGAILEMVKVIGIIAGSATAVLGVYAKILEIKQKRMSSKDKDGAQ